MSLMSFSGKKITEKKRAVRIAANTSRELCTLEVRDLLKRGKRQEVVIHCSLVRDGEELFSKLHYLCPPKEMVLSSKPNVKLDFSDSDEGVNLVVSASGLVKNLMLYVPDNQVFFSANYFDLLPGEKKQVAIRTSLTANDLKKRLKYRHLLTC